MRFVEPKVIRLAETKLVPGAADRLLEALGAEGWTTDAPSDGEALIEMAGRLCYQSFAAGLNPNVTKVREGNAAYVANLRKQQHFSVFEHVHVTYAFLGVSRVFTHELVRHRLSNFSQESLRFVRLTDLGAYWPEVFEELEPEVREAVEGTFVSTFEHLEFVQRSLAEVLELDTLPFGQKKRLTSAMRRLAPIGLTTSIVMTTNLRNWQHIIGLRASEGAEEEIRKVVGAVAEDLRAAYPNVFAEEGLPG